MTEKVSDNDKINQHPLFKERSFQDACRSVVDVCNNIPFEERWAKETPLFAAAILRNLDVRENRVLDYGCGVGRLAKELLARNETVQIVGVDDSPVQLAHARRYVDSARFTPLLPHECQGCFDLIYCIYVLQHIPGIFLRDALARMHYRLRPGGRLVLCTTYNRMTPQYGRDCSFFDDRRLGVNIKAEVERFFEPLGELFTAAELQQNDVVRRMVCGDDGRLVAAPDGRRGLAHPAIVYERREISTPYFDLPLPDWYLAGE